MILERPNFSREFGVQGLAFRFSTSNSKDDWQILLCRLVRGLRVLSAPFLPMMVPVVVFRSMPGRGIGGRLWHRRLLACGAC